MALNVKNVFDIVLIVKKILEIVFIFEERIFVREILNYMYAFGLKIV